MAIKNVNLPHKVALLKRFDVFNLLGEKVLYKIAAALREEFFPAGAYIARQGEETPRHVLFLTIEGKIEITVTDKNGHVMVTGYRGPYEFMGEAAVFSGEGYPASARAVTDTHCYILSQEILEEVIIENPDFATYFTRLLTERLRIMYQRFFNEEDLLQDQGFSKLISDIMVSDVATCGPGDNIRQIARIMSGRNVSSVIVTDKTKPLGIITEGDFVSKVLLEEDLGKSARRTAREIMRAVPVTIGPKEFSYQAFLLMVKYRIKHIAVVDGQGCLAGIVTMRDLIKSRKTGSLAVVNSIESSSTIEELSQLRHEVDQVLQALLVERATVVEITALITEFYDRITRKVMQIAEKAMLAEGYGPPPVNYCWITMGSSGRKEQYARTDQDNGIIYGDVPLERDEAVKKYFLTLGEKAVAGLEAYGFKRCMGKVMANNEQWCRSFRSWRHTIKDWTDNLLPENIRSMTIFLDFRYLYGKKSLYDLLRNFVVRNFRNSFKAQTFLVQDNLNKKVPLSIFRQVQTVRSGEYRHQLNLKTSACVHVVDCIRVFALREGMLVTNTFARLEEMGRRKILREKDIEYITAAYETLMMLRIKKAMSQMRKNIEPDSYINPRELTNREYSQLREALIMVRRLQGITESHFRFLP